MADNKNKILLTVGAVIAIALITLLVVLVFGRDVPETPEQSSTASTAATTEHTDPTQPAETVETLPPAVWSTMPDIDATYEQWLAAAMFVAVTMEHPDFELQGIYVASQTSLEDISGSMGAYVAIVSDGEELLLHSLPLEAQRTQANTTDLYTAQLGFATFDVVENSGVDLAAMQELALEDLGQLMEYSMLVSLYSR